LFSVEERKKERKKERKREILVWIDQFFERKRERRLPPVCG
jgi:hypothetical protein